MAHPLTQIRNFSYETLVKELDLSPKEKESYEHLLLAYEGDFWQRGQGSLLPPASGGRASEVDKVLEKRFVYRNIIQEVVGRVAGSFFGKNPNWRYQVDGEDLVPEEMQPPPADDSETEGGGEELLPEDPLLTLDKALGTFWTKRGAAQVLSEAFEHRLVFGRGGLRIYVPTKYKTKYIIPSENENTPQEEVEEYLLFPDIASAVDAMRIEFVAPRQGKLLDDGGELFSLTQYAVRKDWETKEDVKVVEFSFVDDMDVTWIGTVEEKEGAEGGMLQNAQLSSPFQLGGGTTYNEFKGKPFVSMSLYKNNQLVNLALTCSGFSLVDNGFGEMILTNVELETESIPGPDGELMEVPKRIRRGGGAIQNFLGIEQYDEATGSATRQTPGVTFRQPVPVDSFKTGFDMGYTACLEEANQLYAKISGDAVASGESRIQAMSDFIIRISKYKSEVDEVGSWLLTTVALWAANLAGLSLPQGFRVVFDSRIHVGNVTSSERSAIMAMREKGVISRETERVLLGVDDPALEDEQILREQFTEVFETSGDDFSARLDVGLKMSSLGIDLTIIQAYLGFTPEQIQLMADLAAEREAQQMAQILAFENAEGGGDEGVDGE